MSLKNELFTLINENVEAVICLYDQTKKNSADVLEAMNYLVDGTLEERIIKTRNQNLIKEGSSHFLFTNHLGKSLNIVFTTLPQLPTNHEMTQFIGVVNSQISEVVRDREIVIIKPEGHSYNLPNNVVDKDFSIQSFNY